MLGWFTSKPKCPVDDATREWLDARWRWLEEQFGADRARKATVVLPRAEFFPDEYCGTDEDARRILDRVCGYMDVDPATVEMSLYDETDPLANNPFIAEGTRHGTAGLYHAADGKYHIWVEASNPDDALGMVGTMAHELGHVHLLGGERLSPDAEDHEPLTDLLTVFMGMGVFTANSAVIERSWEDGVRSGWQIGRRGYLDMRAFGYAFALFARSRGEDGSAWSGELRLDVRTAFKQAMGFLDAPGES
jgi:hypothetical protein